MNFSDRDLGLIDNCKVYAASDPAGLPGHNLMLIIAQLAPLLDKLQAVGRVQRSLDACTEHLNHMTGVLVKQGLAERDDKMMLVATEKGGKDFQYHIDRYYSVESYLQQAKELMWEVFGTTDGQLCPYDDCAHDLAIEAAGWCRCGHCKRPFFAHDSDGDFEDYHCRKPRGGENVPQALLWCRNLGPSWGTPKQGVNDE